jgi:rare lipoprotein A
MRFLLNMTLLAVASLIASPSLQAQETGIAVHYSDYFQGKPVANNEIYDRDALTAAHNSYPYGTMVKVTNLENNKSVVVKINDRMRSRTKVLIDLSWKAAEELDMIQPGKAQVRVEKVQ